MPNKIVLVAGADPLEGIGGHSRYVRAHGRAVRRAGFEPHLFCASSQGGVIETEFGVLHRTRLGGLYQLPRFKFWKHLLVWHLPPVARAVESFILTDGGPRLIHAFGRYGCVGVAVSRALRRRGLHAIPLVSAFDTMAREAQAKVHGLSAAHGFFRRLGFRAELLWTRLILDPLERRGYVGSRLVLVNYECVRRHLVQSYGLRVEIRKIPYSSESAFLDQGGSLDAPDVVRQPRSSGTPVIVSVSRHDPRKGIDVLLHALARLRMTGVQFRACLVGAGPLLAAHRRLATRLGLADVTAIEGFVPDPYPYLRHADVFVLPSLEEGSGSLSLIEALQAGVAVVASNVDGIPEDVVDGESALLVKPGDAAELGAAIGRVLGDPALRQRLAHCGRETFAARFSVDAFANALRETYAELGVTP